MVYWPSAKELAKTTYETRAEQRINNKSVLDAIMNAGLLLVAYFLDASRPGQIVRFQVIPDLLIGIPILIAVVFGMGMMAGVISKYIARAGVNMHIKPPIIWSGMVNREVRLNTLIQENLANAFQKIITPFIALFDVTFYFQPSIAPYAAAGLVAAIVAYFGYYCQNYGKELGILLSSLPRGEVDKLRKEYGVRIFYS